MTETVLQTQPATPMTVPRSIRLDELFPPLVRWLLLAALFASYPVALLVPMGSGFNLVFHLALPLFSVMTLVAVAYLAITPASGSQGIPSWRRNAFMAVLWLYVALHLAAAVAGRSADYFRILDTAGLVVLPAFFAVVPWRCLPQRLDLLLLWLWCVQVVHCLLQMRAGYQPVGLAGNRNWAGTLIAVLAPWACLALRRVGGSRRGLNAPIGRVVLQGGVIAISLVLVYACHCRATWLGLASYALIMLLLKPCSWLGRVLLVVALATVMIGAVVAYPEKFTRAIEQDIRIPLYVSTLRMVAARPLLGSGPGNFTRDFVAYETTAQKARAVAAPVTEHPHCELLHVAASAGVPSALLWAIVLGVPLFLSAGTSVRRRLAHGSLWLLLVHGLLDKALVQPPTNVLAVLFAGLLWRPWLRLRAGPACRPAALRIARLPLAVVVLLLSAAVSFRDLYEGILFRRAYLAEAEGQDYENRGELDAARSAYARAYAAYEKSTHVASHSVRAHTYAGICANNKLRDPERALKHIRAAMAIERDFAHLNGEAGLALGTLGRHEEAFAFFEREARLFPFSAEPLQRLIVCASATNRLGLLGSLQAQLLAISTRKVSQTLGDDQTQLSALALRLAVSSNQPQEALAIANALTKPVDPQAAEPPLYSFMDRRLIDAIRLSPFGSLDADYWHSVELARQRRTRLRATRPADMISLLRTCVADGCTPAEARSQMLDAARLEGYSPAYLQQLPSMSAVRFVELRRGTERWLLDLDRGETSANVGIVSLLTQAAVRDERGVRREDLAGAAVVLPAHPLQFFSRTQVLGGLVGTTCRASAIPLTYSPMAEAASLQISMAAELDAAGLDPRALPVAYDRARIHAFAEAIKALLKPPSAPALLTP